MSTYIVTIRGDEAEDVEAMDVREAIEQYVPHNAGTERLDIDVEKLTSYGADRVKDNVRRNTFAPMVEDVA